MPVDGHLVRMIRYWRRERRYNMWNVVKWLLTGIFTVVGIFFMLPFLAIWFVLVFFFTLIFPKKDNSKKVEVYHYWW